MDTPRVNPAKMTTAAPQVTSNDVTQEKADAVVHFFNLLTQDAEKFSEEDTFNVLYEYIKTHNRILYAPISNEIYSCYNKHSSDEAGAIIGAISTNMDKLVSYAAGQKCHDRRKKLECSSEATETDKNDITMAIKQFEDAQKAVLKIWDHINLAQQQYSVLKQSDTEYKQKFESLIEPYKTQMTQDMNSQLLTMVSIFTALAFLVFGGISSLDNIFSSQGIPLLKLMCVGSVWGLCILNLIFVFLFCISKMTNLSFKSTNDPNANIFQKYPVIWWTDLMLLSILALCSWAYYVRKNNFDGWLNELFENYRPLVVIAGTLIIVWMIWKSVKWLTTKTSYHPQNSNK